MTILHAILSKEFAGSERYACQLASLQAQAGHKVLLLIKDANPAYRARVEAEAAPAPVVRIPGWWPSFLDYWAMRGVVNGFAPLVVHTHLGRATSRMAKAIRNMKPEGEHPRPAHVATLHLEYRKDYAACDGLICIAEWQRAGIPATFAGAVTTVWNWVKPAQSKAKSKASKGPHTFLSVGRLVPHKGMDVLVQAFCKAFPKGDKNVRLRIAGAGPQRAELEKLAAGDARIELLGYVADVEALYPQADTYVSAARYEPFGLTILEAMQTGCRLVCTKTQGPCEFLADYKLEWATPGDVASLAKALKAAAKTQGRVAWDMTPFAPQTACAEIENFYRQVNPEVPGLR